MGGDARQPVYALDWPFPETINYYGNSHLSNLLVQDGGKILIGEIPLADKAQAYFEERRKKPFLNFFLNARYHVKKFLLKAMYGFGKVDETQTTGLKYTRPVIQTILGKIPGMRFELLEQDKKLPFANSREDLLILRAV